MKRNCTEDDNHKIVYSRIYFLVIRRQPGTTRTDTQLPNTTLFRSELPALKLDRAEFKVAIETDPEQASEFGIDGVGFAVRTNPGTLPGPLMKIASLEEHTSAPQSLTRISYAVLCLKKESNQDPTNLNYRHTYLPTIDVPTHPI